MGARFDAQRNLILNVRAETGLFDSQQVGSDREAWEEKRSVRARADFLSEPRAEVQHIDGGIWHRCPARVAHGPPEARGRELPPGILRRQHDGDRQKREHYELETRLAAICCEHLSLLKRVRPTH